MRHSSRFFLLLALAIAFFGVLLYFPTFSASFAYDDVDYLRDAADALAGKTQYWKIILRPQGEHFVPALRMLIHASASLFGTEATPFRLLVFLCHIASAFLLGLVARRYLSNAAGIAAGLAYVVPSGFSSMWVWYPSGGSVPIGLLGITGGIAALAYRDSLGWTRARMLAAAGALFAILYENTLVPLVLIPAFVDELERRRETRRRWPGVFAIFCILLAVVSIFLSSSYYTRLTGNELTLNWRPALPRAVLLLSVAPYRFFFPGTPLPRPFGKAEELPLIASLFGAAVFFGLAALLVALLRPEARRLTATAIATAAGPIGVVALVAVGRWKAPYEELYDADRYFFTLLIPVSLLVGVLMHGIAARTTAWPATRRLFFAGLLAAGFCAELALHAAALRRRVPWDVYATHERRFGELAILSRRLSAAADALPRTEPPLHFPDTAFSLPDVHNNKISARFLLHVASPRKSPRLVLADPPVSARDAQVINPVLERWSREVGASAPALSIVNGDLVDARAGGQVDFRVKPHATEVVGGFYGWEGVSRWMGKEGELRLQMTGDRLHLMLAVPWPSVQNTYPDRESLGLAVSLRDEATGERADLGVLKITAAGIEKYDLPVPEPFASTARGHRVRLLLRSDQTWRPIDVLPASSDERVLSVQAFRVAFEE